MQNISRGEKMNNLSKFMKIFIITAMIIWPFNRSQASTKEVQAKKIENVLDKLEQRLIDKESSPLNLDEEEKGDIKNNKNASPTQKYSPKKPAKVTGQTAGSKNLRELQKKLNDYDTRIEVLESEFRKIQAGVFEGSTVDNQITIKVKAGNESKFIIRTITARLDGNILYNQLDPAGLWMPARSIPVYFGPLQPGDHRLDLSATVAPLSEDGLDLANWKQKSLQQSFNFSISEGKQRRTIDLEINTPKGPDSRPIAKLIEAETK